MTTLRWRPRHMLGGFIIGAGLALMIGQTVPQLLW